MKKLLTLIIYLLKHRSDEKRDDEKETFEHLDGAEFYAVLPEETAQVVTK